MRRWRIVFNVLLVIISVSICVAGIEYLALRVKKNALAHYQHSPPRKRIPYEKGVWERSQAWRNEILLNNHSFHDFDRTYECEKGERVVFIGDSFVEAYQVPRDVIFYNQLNADFVEHGIDVECMGIGRSAFGVLGYTWLYEKYVKLFERDLVVVVLYVSNDPRNDHLEYQSLTGWKPEFVLTPSNTVVPTGQYIKGWRCKVDLEKSKPLWTVNPLWNKYFPGITWMVTSASANSWFVYDIASRLKIVARRPERRRLHDYTGYLLKERPDYVNEAFAYCVSNLVRLQERVHRDGDEFVVVLLPGRELADLNWVRDKIANHPDSAELEYDLDWAHGYLDRELAERGVRCYDFLQDYRAAIEDGVKPYIEEDKHLTPAGHALLADLLKRDLQVFFQ